MPAPLSRMVGRSDVVPALAEQLLRHRFVTLVGPGGIGKTTVAVAVANRLLGNFADGVRFVDLAPLTDPLLVPSTLAALLGVGVRSDNPMPSLIAFLREKAILIVLDNCEHVIEAAATLAEEIFRGTTRTYILATSREALRAEGERVHRLPTLGFPTDTSGIESRRRARISFGSAFRRARGGESRFLRARRRGCARSSRTSAAGWTGSRSPSRLRQAASILSGLPGWRRGSTTASSC